MNNKRYKIIEGFTNHSFEYSVVDTGQLDYNGEHNVIVLCECLFEVDAKLICDALNIVRTINKGKRF
jgi:hypothetical protein